MNYIETSTTYSENDDIAEYKKRSFWRLFNRAIWGCILSIMYQEKRSRFLLLVFRFPIALHFL